MSARQALLVVAIATLTLASFGLGVLGAHVASPARAAGAAPSLESAAHASASSSALASRLAYEHQVLTTAKKDGIPLSAVSLPNLLGQAKVSNGVVSPISKVAPAPMGIGTFGVRNTTGTPSAYSIRSTSWEGSITIDNVNTFLLDNDGALSTNGANNTFGVQLNTVTANTTVLGQSSYSFWTQNVLYFNLVPGTVTFLDNIWNFSSPATSLLDHTIYSGNGTPVYPEFYYDFGPTIAVTLPVTVHLYLNSSTTNLVSTGYGYTTVRFGYDIVNAATHATEAAGIYDTVLFNSTIPAGSVPSSPFLVDGSQLTPTNFLLYDAEIMIGGPGGGTTTSVYGINATESLQYWNASLGRYVTPPSAWNVGTDTGETSEGIAETYTTPGSVQVTAGPSIPTPFWNATPGGNVGRATFSGPISPSNAFVFFTPGASFDQNTAAWAPTQTASHVTYVLPPGTYTVTTMLSDYTPIQTTATVGSGGSVALSLNLHRNTAEGIYTPLFAWNNGQLAAISRAGHGSAGQPYLLENNPAPGGLNPVFGEFNDYIYQVFPGVLIAGTTAHVDLVNPFLLNVTYPSAYWAGLERLDLPVTNNLQFEFFDTSNLALWGAHGISGWFFYEDYGPTGLLPLANVVVWGGTHDLVGANTFQSQGSALLLAGSNPSAPTGNVVWGNTFLNSTALSPTMYPAGGAVNGPPVGIFAFEAGDLIYNNRVDTSIPAYAPDQNMFYGFGQLNLENWNLPMVEPWFYGTVFNGFVLIGTIVPSVWQGGNSWGNYVVGSGLPYTDYGFIASGGDSFPLPITAYVVEFTLSEPHGVSVSWSVTLNGVTETTGGHYLVFYETPGSYAFTDAVVHGAGTISPSSGTVTVTTTSMIVPLKLS
jgi:thermopsin